MSAVARQPPGQAEISQAVIKPLRILVDSFADAGLINAQMSNGREIIARLDPQRFHVSVFVRENPDPRIAQRPNTRLIWLPQRRQTPYILREFLFGGFDIIFYVKGSPGAKIYFRVRHLVGNRSIAVGTMESRSDGRNEPTISAEAIRSWQQTTLRCDWLFSNSSAVQRNLQEECGLASDIIPTGVDTRFFTPARTSANINPQVFFAGSLRPFKQPQILLEAARRFPGADFTIAGDGPMAEELRRQIAAQGLTNAHLVGSLSAADLRDRYCSSDIFLFPSGWEGSPKVILEAAACGLPVIARKDYEPETVLDGQTGFLVSSNEELFDRLERLLGDRSLCQKLGAAGRLHAQTFDWDRITPQWEEAFLRVASQKTRLQTA